MQKTIDGIGAKRTFKLIIIGAGTAGLSALKEATRVTDDVLLINDGPYGTTCARVGCMPSKALLAVARDFDSRGFQAEAGIRGVDRLSVDLPAVMNHVRQLRDRFVAGPIRSAQSHPYSITGRPRFIDANTLEVNGETVHTETTIIATGSRPQLPEDWRQLGDRVVTTDEFFELEHPGQTVAVVGLGPIGAELGQALGQLGVEVHGFTRGALVGGLSDPEVSQALADGLKTHMKLYLNADVTLESGGDSVLVRAGEQCVKVDRVLAALGRRPNLEGLGLEGLDVPLDERGVPTFDGQTLRLGTLPIFITGDVNQRQPLLHEAADDGRLAVWYALNPEADCMARRTPLAIVFSEPNAARVGQAWRDLPQERIIIGQADFGKQARALMEGQNQGVLHVYADREDHRILGAELAVPGGEHLAHLLAWSVQQRLTVDQMLQMPFYHPVVEEGLRTALQSARRQFEARERMLDLPQCHEPADWALA